MPSSSQGTTVSFNGTALGSLLSSQATGGTAVTAEATTVDSSVVGTGAATRVRRQVEVTGIDPGGVTVRLLGMPPYSRDNIGTIGTLAFTTPAGSVSHEAYLQSYDVEASVGELLRGSATFTFTGS